MCSSAASSEGGPARRAALLLAVVAFVSCGERAEGPVPVGRTGELVVTSDRDRTLAFLDGRFIGLLERSGDELAVVVEAGRHELRLTAPTAADVAAEVDVGRASRVVLAGRLGRLDQGSPTPDFAPILAPGQTVRLGPTRPDAADESRSTVAYTVSGALESRLLIVVTLRAPPVSFRLIGPEGELPLAPLEDASGLAGRELFAFTLPATAGCRLEVGKPAATPLVFRLCAAPPPRAPETPGQPGRRLPPTPR